MSEAVSYLAIPLLTMAGVIVGAMIEQARQRRHWNRAAIRAFTRAPMRASMPTMTAELTSPAWTRPHAE